MSDVLVTENFYTAGGHDELFMYLDMYHRAAWGDWCGTPKKFQNVV